MTTDRTLRYYVSYAFDGGFGSIDITTPRPITGRADLIPIRDIVNRKNGWTLPSLMILGFSRYEPSEATPDRKSVV